MPSNQHIQARRQGRDRKGDRMPEIVWLNRLADAVEQARASQAPIFVDFAFPG